MLQPCLQPNTLYGMHASLTVMLAAICISIGWVPRLHCALATMLRLHRSSVWPLFSCAWSWLMNTMRCASLGRVCLVSGVAAHCGSVPLPDCGSVPLCHAAAGDQWWCGVDSGAAATQWHSSTTVSGVLPLT